MCDANTRKAQRRLEMLCSGIDLGKLPARWIVEAITTESRGAPDREAVLTLAV